MSNPAPHQARKACALARKRAKACGINKLREKLWNRTARLDVEVSDGEGLPEEKLRHVHTLIQSCAAYMKVVEAGELEARLAALEGAA